MVPNLPVVSLFQAQPISLNKFSSSKNTDHIILLSISICNSLVSPSIIVTRTDAYSRIAESGATGGVRGSAA